MPYRDRKAEKVSYYAANRQRILDRQHAYRREHLAEVRERERAYRAKPGAKERKRRNADQRAELLRRYQMSRAAYASLLARQGGVCAICLQPETHVHPRSGVVQNLSIDHDHGCCPGTRSCGRCVRGLLCKKCNHLIARFDDNPGLLLRAASYVSSGR